MKNFCKHSIWLMLLVFMVAGLNAQTCKLTGKVLDKGNNQPVIGAIVSLVSVRDTTNGYYELTNNNGSFVINAKQGLYRLKITNLSYQDYKQVMNLTSSSYNVGSILMQESAKELAEVVVEGQKAPVVQKGDTTEMSASAYKVNTDADAINLVQKMPGITVDNGTVKAHGEEIKKVMVDGKNFFGDDVSMALQNLPADMVDKVQVFNKLSDQSEFTGVDDGQSQKVLNIITRSGAKKIYNGKFTAGHGDGDNYLANGRLNIFKGQQRITLTGGSNNVNQQNFSMQDLLGSMFRGGGGRGGGQFIGRSSGLNTTHSAGINFNTNLGKKITVNGSYFFNQQENYLNQNSYSQYLGIRDSLIQAKYMNQTSVSTSKNYNHRFNMRFEYQIDSLNSILWSPRISWQRNKRWSDNDGLKYTDLEDPMLTSLGNSFTNGLGYNYSNDLLFRHKFMKKGRTFSLGLSGSGSVRNTDGLNYSNDKTKAYTLVKDQESDSETNGLSFSSNASYTEPISSKSIIMASYTIGFDHNSTDRYVYDRSVEPHTRLDSVSNVYKSDYNTQRLGLTYMLNTTKLNANFGADYQFADLSGQSTFPKEGKVDKTFENVLPNARITYKYSKLLNFMMFYRTFTSQPSVTQLQDVVDVSSSTNFTKGNPELRHQYSHNTFINMRYSNPEKFTNFSINLIGTYNLDPIGNKTMIMTHDTIIQGQRLLQNGMLTMPVNMKNSWNTNIFMNYGFLFQPLKCNFNFQAGSGYSSTPGYVNSVISITKAYSLNGGMVIASNISENLDFTGSYNVNYTTAKNSVQPRLNTNIYNHVISLSSNITILKSWVITNNLSEQINRGYSGSIDNDYFIWNASLGKKVFKDKSGQLSINVYDLLNQNKSISRSVSELAITDTRSNTLGRYFMLSFTYTLRSKRGNPGENQRRGDFFGPFPGGMHMGPPPGGAPPTGAPMMPN